MNGYNRMKNIKIKRKLLKKKKAAREELPLPIDTCGLAE